MMQKTIIGSTALMGLMAAMAWGSSATLAQAPNGSATMQAMARCARIADDAARHDCMDAVMIGAGLLKPGQSTQAPAQAPAQPSSTQPSAPQSPAAPAQPQAQAPQAPTQAPPAQAPVQAQTPPPAQTAAPQQQANTSPVDSFISKPEPKAEKSPSRIEVTLSDVRKRGDGKFILTSTDGTVWRQLYTQSMHSPPQPGDSMSVHKNSLGGYICRVGKRPSFRCSPVS